MKKEYIHNGLSFIIGSVITGFLVLLFLGCKTTVKKKDYTNDNVFYHHKCINIILVNKGLDLTACTGYMDILKSSQKVKSANERIKSCDDFKKEGFQTYRECTLYKNKD